MTMDYVVKDLSLSDFGRKEINIAETEMPGLMAIREEFKGKKPLKGAKIADIMAILGSIDVIMGSVDR